MNYNKIYDNIIKKAINEKRKRGEQYYENHHIIPKCMGGNNKKENLVLLTAKEHFLCHHLLYKIYPENKKLICAFWLMSTRNGYKVTSIVFEKIKLERSILTKESNSKRKLSEKTKEKIRNSKIGKSWGKHSDDSKQRISEGNKGKKYSDDSKRKISLSLKGENHPNFGKRCSDTRRENIKKSRLKTIKKECPHCGVKMDPGNAKRYHFDNCKKRGWKFVIMTEKDIF